MSDRSTRLSRRNFLLTAGAAAGAATAAAVVTSRKSSPVQTKDKRATRGYQASEHVSNYYRTAKV